VLAGAVGGLGVLTADAIARSSAVRAVDNYVVLGGDNFAAVTTRVTNNANNASTMLCWNPAGGAALEAESNWTAVLAKDVGNSRAVVGQTGGGVALLGSATTGLALHAAGRAKFDSSGVATIPANQTSVTVTPGVNVTSASFVLLTPKSNLFGRSLWYTTNPGADTFGIRMSSAKGTPTKVAWLLLG
jgi:hypothetical protein